MHRKLRQEPQQQNGNWSRAKTIAAVAGVVVALGSALVSGATRLAAVEIQQRETNRRLERIEVQLDRLTLTSKKVNR